MQLIPWQIGAKIDQNYCRLGATQMLDIVTQSLWGYDYHFPYVRSNCRKRYFIASHQHNLLDWCPSSDVDSSCDVQLANWRLSEKSLKCSPSFLTLEISFPYCGQGAHVCIMHSPFYLDTVTTLDHDTSYSSSTFLSISISKGGPPHLKRLRRSIIPRQHDCSPTVSLAVLYWSQR